jgi:hypothetical protein
MGEPQVALLAVFCGQVGDGDRFALLDGAAIPVNGKGAIAMCTFPNTIRIS